MTVRANERIVFMKHYRLDFGTFIHHENGIFEAIVDDGIELSEEMVKEFFELIKSIEPKIKLCLVNRKNRYSYSFKANFMLASSKLADYVAVVKNDRRIWPVNKLFTPKFYGIAFFDNYNEAIFWLLEKDK